MTERTYPLVHQVLEARALRVFLFCLSLVTLAYIDLRIGGVMLDPNCIYPFLILLSAPTSLCLKLGWRTITIVRKCCLPAGISVCGLNLIVLVSNADDIASFGYRLLLLYTPLVLGIFIFFSLSILENVEVRVFSLSKIEKIGLSFVTIISFLAAASALAIRNDSDLTAFISGRAILMATFIVFFSFASPHQYVESFVKKLKISSLVLLLISVTIGVYTYTITVMEQSDFANPFASIAFATLGILYGSLLAIFAISAECKSSEESRNDMAFDWHIVEAYAFYALIIFPPVSILEYYFQ